MRTRQGVGPMSAHAYPANTPERCQVAVDVAHGPRARPRRDVIPYAVDYFRRQGYAAAITPTPVGGWRLAILERVPDATEPTTRCVFVPEQLTERKQK